MSSQASPALHAETTSRPVKLHLEYIDGLRAIAMLMVYFLHSWQLVERPFDQWWNPLGIGYSGVSLFLVLSGFCLYWPMVKNGRSVQSPSFKDFMIRRARRILPPYYAALIIFTGLIIVAGKFGIRSHSESMQGSSSLETTFLWHLAMIHHLSPEHMWRICAPMWSLGLEFNLYIAMPILVIIARKFGILSTVAFAALVTVTYSVWLMIYLGGVEGWDAVKHEFGYTLLFFLPGRWLEFALGMWAAQLIASGSLQQNKWPLAWFGGAVFCVAYLIGRHMSELIILGNTVFGFSFFLILISLSQMKKRQPLLSVLQFKPLVWLGSISYSAYLIHDGALRFFIPVAFKQGLSQIVVFLICVTVLLALTIGISYLFFLAFERPFLNSRSKTATSASAPILAEKLSVVSEPALGEKLV